MDLCDRRGRLARLTIAATIGAVVSIVVLQLIRGVATKPNPDAISQVSPVLLGIAMFVVTSVLVLSAIDGIRRRSNVRADGDAS